MLELFSKVPDGLSIPDGNQLTPIQVGEDVSNLSAILLNDTYYGFIKTGMLHLDGLPIVGVEHLMALKANAWLDLTARKARGESVDSDNIAKHKKDVFRLYQLADPGFAADIPSAIQTDMGEFLRLVRMDGVDLKSLGLKGMDLNSVLEDIQRMFVKE